MTRLTASRRRQRPQQVADACGLPLNDKHLIHSRVEYRERVSQPARFAETARSWHWLV